MDSDSSDPLFPFNVFLHSASDSAAVAAQNPRRKRTKFIKPTADRRLALAPAPSTSKPKHAKKPDPAAPKITRPCTECGKKFWSWKALFGHMRCHPERQWRGINPPPNLRRFSAESESTPPLTEEDHEIATCLIMLANGSATTDAIEEAVTETDGECPGILREPELDRFVECAGPPSSCRFECSSCKKVFGSHQALGGHRASHKNVKGCFAVARTDGGGGAAEEYCSVCMKVISRGEAACEDRHRHPHHRRRRRPNSGYFDLNLPPPMEDIEESSSSHSSSGIVLDLRLGIN